MQVVALSIKRDVGLLVACNLTKNKILIEM